LRGPVGSDLTPGAGIITPPQSINSGRAIDRAAPSYSSPTPTRHSDQGSTAARRSCKKVSWAHPLCP
jgi:hypothetical protein